MTNNELTVQRVSETFGVTTADFCDDPKIGTIFFDWMQLSFIFLYPPNQKKMQ